MTESTRKVRTPLYPLYSVVHQLVTIWQGVSKSAVKDMIKAIREQTGTPKNPVDWSDPDVWIQEKLTSENAELAQRIWSASQGVVNPRYTYGSYLFISTHELLEPDAKGIYQLTQRGQGFLNKDLDLVSEIDDTEGLLQLLTILSVKIRAKRADLLPEWTDFLHEYSKFGSSTTIRETMRRRLLNLIERDLIRRESNTYIITNKGINYAARYTPQTATPRKKVIRNVSAYNDKQRTALQQKIGTMHPYHFEHLVRELLEAMGYEDVTVTKESGDKGVDVVATVQFGITTIKEVIQVKRYKGNIGRPILDQLRGALPYHKAIRGTIITTGGFTQGCRDAALFPGAAPIGLINGDKLLDLLIEHEIGIQKQSISLYELDDEFFRAFDRDGMLDTVD
ncbi:MAG: restriction endonuclease [Chloroflexi bacterium]|nr:restriction endonuclease [Chloroflexota bacterium]